MKQYLSSRLISKPDLYPIIISISAIMVFSYTVSFFSSTNFQAQLTEYTQVVDLVISGEIRAEPSGFAQLPVKYQHLSKCGGEIFISQDGASTLILFTENSHIWSVEGYVYQSNNQFPAANQLPGWYEWSCDELALENWYYCSGYD